MAGPSRQVAVDKVRSDFVSLRKQVIALQRILKFAPHEPEIRDAVDEIAVEIDQTLTKYPEDG